MLKYIVFNSVFINIYLTVIRVCIIYLNKLTQCGLLISIPLYQGCTVWEFPKEEIICVKKGKKYYLLDILYISYRYFSFQNSVHEEFTEVKTRAMWEDFNITQGIIEKENSDILLLSYVQFHSKTKKNQNERRKELQPRMKLSFFGYFMFKIFYFN